MTQRFAGAEQEEGSAAPWLVMDSQANDIFCKHCGESHPLAGMYPIKLSTFTALLDGLARQHAACACPPGGPLERQRPAPRTDGTVLQRAEWWLDESLDTGISSKTIAQVLLGRFLLGGRVRPDVPHDPDDFGRCSRLLALIPEWRLRLAEVALIHSAWGPLVEAWDELEKLYQEELPAGKAPRLYARMRELIAEGRGGAWSK